MLANDRNHISLSKGGYLKWSARSPRNRGVPALQEPLPQGLRLVFGIGVALDAGCRRDEHDADKEDGQSMGRGGNWHWFVSFQAWRS